MPTKPENKHKRIFLCPYCDAGPFELLGRHSTACINWPKELRWCKRCNEIKPLKEFYKNVSKSSGYHSMCKACNKKHIKKQYKKYPERFSRVARAFQQRLRIIVLTKYCNGEPACQCCGEKNQSILCLDHINGNGRAHREKVKGRSLYAWIRQNNYPPIFQVLCHNCNASKDTGTHCTINHAQSIHDMQERLNANNSVSK